MDFDKLYQEHAKLVWHYVYAKCQDPELANDIVQTTFLKAISQIEGFRGECKLTAWLCQIARNEWLNHCRKMKRQVSLEGYLEMHGEETYQNAMKQAMAEKWNEFFKEDGLRYLGISSIGYISKNGEGGVLTVGLRFLTKSGWEYRVGLEKEKSGKWQALVNKFH